MEAKSIERIAEELGVNFYDLRPLISARDNFMKREGIRVVVEWVRANTKLLSIYMGEDLEMCDEWQAFLKERGIE